MDMGLMRWKGLSIVVVPVALLIINSYIDCTPKEASDDRWRRCKGISDMTNFMHRSLPADMPTLDRCKKYAVLLSIAATGGMPNQSTVAKLAEENMERVDKLYQTLEISELMNRYMTAIERYRVTKLAPAFLDIVDCLKLMNLPVVNKYLDNEELIIIIDLYKRVLGLPATRVDINNLNLYRFHPTYRVSLAYLFNGYFEFDHLVTEEVPYRPNVRTELAGVAEPTRNLDVDQRSPLIPEPSEREQKLKAQREHQRKYRQSHTYQERERARLQQQRLRLMKPIMLREQERLRRRRRRERQRQQRDASIGRKRPARLLLIDPDAFVTPNNQAENRPDSRAQAQSLRQAKSTRRLPPRFEPPFKLPSSGEAATSTVPQLETISPSFVSNSRPNSDPKMPLSAETPTIPALSLLPSIEPSIIETDAQSANQVPLSPKQLPLVNPMTNFLKFGIPASPFPGYPNIGPSSSIPARTIDRANTEADAVQPPLGNTTSELVYPMDSEVRNQRSQFDDIMSTLRTLNPVTPLDFEAYEDLISYASQLDDTESVMRAFSQEKEIRDNQRSASPKFPESPPDLDQ